MDRSHLLEILRALSSPEFEMLVFALNPPRGILPPPGSEQSIRAIRLVEWAEGPTGRGIDEICDWLNNPQRHRTHSSQNSPHTPPPSPRPTVRNDAPPAQPEEQRGGWRGILQSTEATVTSIALIITGLTTIFGVVKFLPPSSPKEPFQPFPPSIDEAVLSEDQINQILESLKQREDRINKLYKDLDDSVSAWSFHKADQETRELMIQIANRSSDDFLDGATLRNFDCVELQKIDQKWHDASKQKLVVVNM